MNEVSQGKETARREVERMIEAYLDRMCAKIKAKELHPELREEMRGHIDELIADRESEEDSPQEAAAWALEQMGDADEVGSTLGRVHKPKFNWRLLLPIAVMAGLGLLALFSLSAAGEGHAQYFNFGLNQLYYYGLGAIVLALFVFADYRLLRKYAVPLYAITAVLTMLFFSVRSVSMDGTQSWIVIGPIALNWTLCMLILFLSALPGLFECLRFQKAKWNGIPHLLAVGAILLPVALYVYFDLIAWLPLCAYGIAAFMIYARCGGSRLYLITATVAAIGWAGSMYLRDANWRERIEAVFTRKPTAAGLSNESMAAAIREGGWFGKGFGASGASVPIPTSDTLLPYLTHSFGWSAAALLVGSIVWLIVLLLRSARLIADSHGRLLILGLSVFLAAQWLYGIGASFGWLPFTTLGMPLIGYGGTSTLVYCAVIGLILGIYRRKDMIPSSGGAFEIEKQDGKKLLLKIGRVQIYAVLSKASNHHE